MPWIAILLCVFFFVSSCASKQSSDGQMLSHQEKSKAVVALAPIIDHTDSDIPWSLSEEFTTSIQKRLLEKEKFHVIQQEKIQAIASEMKDPFEGDLTWIKNLFTNDDFVIFVEMIKHNELAVQKAPINTVKEAAIELNMQARLRVVDLRSTSPEIVLQEIITDTHFIPKRFTRFNQEQVPWGQEQYFTSPVGIAHANFSKQIAVRAEEYILLAKRGK